MPFVPTDPFPKKAGHAIKSSDWNDLVGETQRLGVETQRLDDAKLDKAGGGVTGPLTIQATKGAAEWAVDVDGNINLRSGFLTLFRQQAKRTRALIGLVNDNTLGVSVFPTVSDSKMPFTINVDTGNVYINGTLQTSANVGINMDPDGPGGAALTVNGRVRDSKLRLEAREDTRVEIIRYVTTTAWSPVPNMSLTVGDKNSPAAWFYVRFEVATASVWVTGAPDATGEFRLLIDGNRSAYGTIYYRDGASTISLQRLVYLSGGTQHAIVVQWSVKGSTSGQVGLIASLSDTTRSLIAVEL